MKTGISRRLVVVTALLAAASLAPAAADWLLRLAVEEGDTYRFAMSQTQSIDMDMGPMGRQEVQNSSRTEFLQSVRERLSDGAVVLDVAFGAMRSKMSLGGMALEFDSEKPGDPSHPMAKLQQFMQGKRFSVTMTPEGRVRSVDGLDEIFDGFAEAFADSPGAREALEAMTPAFKSASIETMMQQAVLLYPEHAVGVGDTWQQRLSFPNPALGDLNVANDYTVEGAERKKQRDCVRIGVRSKVGFEGDAPLLSQFGEMMGTDLSLDIGEASGEGTVWVDVARGLVVLSKSSQTIDMDLAFQTPPAGDGAAGQPVEMHASITQEVEVELLD
jgi:hypothetical protein